MAFTFKKQNISKQQITMRLFLNPKLKNVKNKKVHKFNYSNFNIIQKINKK